MTDLRGVETHGVSNMLRAYVRDYRAGKLDPRPGWRIEREAPATAVIDAGKRLGIIVGPKAMRLAIEKARRVGVGVVTVYNSGHFGAIGHFAMQAARRTWSGSASPPPVCTSSPPSAPSPCSAPIRSRWPLPRGKRRRCSSTRPPPPSRATRSGSRCGSARRCWRAG